MVGHQRRSNTLFPPRYRENAVEKDNFSNIFLYTATMLRWDFSLNYTGFIKDWKILPILHYNCSLRNIVLSPNGCHGISVGIEKKLPIVYYRFPSIFFLNPHGCHGISTGIEKKLPIVHYLLARGFF